MSSTTSPANVQTYHCICASLLLATTHTLSTLPRRAAPSLDAAIILPLPSSPPSFSSAEGGEAGESEADEDIPAEGYSMLLGMIQDTKPMIIRREDGFEKRLAFRCSRCSVVVGYEILGAEKTAGEGHAGRIVYLLPAGTVSTEVMARGGTDGNGEKWMDGSHVEIGKPGGVAVFE
jgi:hypothetical protein